MVENCVWNNNIGRRSKGGRNSQKLWNIRKWSQFPIIEKVGNSHIFDNCVGMLKTRKFPITAESRKWANFWKSENSSEWRVKYRTERFDYYCRKSLICARRKKERKSEIRSFSKIGGNSNIVEISQFFIFPRKLKIRKFSIIIVESSAFPPKNETWMWFNFTHTHRDLSFSQRKNGKRVKA